MQKNKVGLLSHTMNKNELKWIKDLNVRPESIKHLERNIGRKLFGIDFSKKKKYVSPQAKETKAKRNKWDYRKLKKLLHSELNYQ